MAPTSLTLFAGLLVFGTVLAAPVAKPQSGNTFTLGNPETTVTFEPGFAPPRDSPEFPKWLWYYWLNKYKEEHGDDDYPSRPDYPDRPERPDRYDNFDGFSGASSSVTWSKRDDPVRGKLPVCTAVARGIACLSNPTTTVTVTNPPDEEPEYPEDPEYPEEEPEDPEWPEEEPPKGWPKPPQKPNQPPRYPPTKPEPPKWPQPPKQPPKYPPYEPEDPVDPDYPWDDEPEEPAGGSITTSTYCTDAKKGITWNC